MRIYHEARIGPWGPPILVACFWSQTHTSIPTARWVKHVFAKCQMRCINLPVFWAPATCPRLVLRAGCAHCLSTKHTYPLSMPNFSAQPPQSHIIGHPSSPYSTTSLSAAVSPAQYAIACVWALRKVLVRKDSFFHKIDWTKDRTYLGSKGTTLRSATLRFLNPMTRK
jgi:hypothetical protein